MQESVYVSITGLRVLRARHIPTFWWHAIRSMNQARTAPGNVSADARTIDGVHHTLSVWESKDAMRAYLNTGPHLDAMRLFTRIATGKTVGFQTDKVPDWSEARAIWLEEGKSVPTRPTA